MSVSNDVPGMLKPHVRFISEKWPTQYGTTLMRCLQPMEYLSARGWSSEINNIYRQVIRESVVFFFHRIRLDEVAKAIVGYIRNIGGILVYDTDDLIFSSDRSATHAEGLQGATMHLCNAITVSTDYLAERARLLVPDVRVMRNGLSHNYLREADRIFNFKSLEKQRDGKITIGYCSGSAHHDDDLAFIVPALAEILESNPSVKFHLVGKIRIPDLLRRFGERVILKPFMPYVQFPSVYADIDINLAPLVLSNPLALGRSELKYIEAGACGIPTIASPNGAYRYAISNGVTGFLAEEPRTWRETLQKLIEHPDLRIQMGVRARAHTLGEYGPDKRAQEWNDLLEDLVSRYGQQATKGNQPQRWLNLSWIMFQQRKRAIRLFLRKIIRRNERTSTVV